MNSFIAMQIAYNHMSSCATSVKAASLEENKRFAQAINHFEAQYKQWRSQVTVACSCGRGVAIPPNLRCEQCLMEWRARSAAARRAVATKRAKYVRWPTRPRKEAS